MPAIGLLTGGSAASGTNLFTDTPNTVTLSVTNPATSGAIGNHNLFNVTGAVYVAAVLGQVLSDLTSSGAPDPTISLGATAKYTIFIAATTAVTGGTPTMTAANGIWVSTTPTAGALALANAATGSGNGVMVIADYITYTIAGNTITGGSIRVNVIWHPLSADGNVEAIASVT